MKNLCVFCGSSSGGDPRFADAACQLGRRLASDGIGIVYGGASVGLMGALADAALAAGGRVVGVIPHGLADRELAHQGLTALHVVDSMHERKQRMGELSDGFVALPGGLGTLEELFEVLTWALLGIHQKPCAVLDVAGYWQPLLAFLDGARDDGFIRPVHRQLLIVERDIGALLATMAAYRSPIERRWLEPGQE